MRLFQDFLSLFYPDLCLACERNLTPAEESLCISCQFKLPRTNFHQNPENPFLDRFWGRLPLHAGAAMMHFVKGGLSQRLIHKLKYKNHPEIGEQLGHLYGLSLRNIPHFEGINLIVPVPLHPKKRHHRGYNQSEYIARGISNALRIPMDDQILHRYHYTVTQTEKSRMERFDNVVNAFVVREKRLKGANHILLVDDVITTGATLEACALKILECRPEVKVSMVTLAIAQL